MLIGYDVELFQATPNKSDAKAINTDFLKKIKNIHQDMNAPCTLFSAGQTVENNIQAFQELKKSSLFDIQQHTYSHVLFKTIVRKTETGVEYVRSGSLEQIQE